MKKTALFVLFLLQILSFGIPSAHASNQSNQETDFYVLTIPKSGSHLILKMLTMLTNKTHVFAGLVFSQLNAFTFSEEDPLAYISDEEMGNAFATWKRAHQFPLAHFNFSESFHQFSLLHPQYVKIIQIRDLRDVCLSCAHQHAEQIEDEIGPCTFDEKLLFVITLSDKPTKHPYLRIEKNARLAVKYMEDPNTLVCRFENLVGLNGGGNREDQIRQIEEIARGLNIEVQSSQIDWIVENLFGTATGPQILSTFREGKIGSWKNYFKDEHIKAFNEVFGDLQTALGYPSFI